MTKAVTNQILIQEEIKRKLNSGNAFYHSVQKLLSSRLLSRNLKTDIQKSIILPVVWRRKERKEYRLRGGEENRVVRKVN
jgi:hypothetical protein